MNTEIRQKLGIEFPIFAFTHCRDVVAPSPTPAASACSEPSASTPNSWRWS